MTGAKGGDHLRGIWVWAAAAVVVVLLGAVTGVLVGDATSSSATPSVTLEPAGAPGADPFTESVAIGAVSRFPGNVQAVNASLREGLDTDSRTGTLVAAGTAPGLYGGSGDSPVCDPHKLVTFLRANPAKARAWASVFGIPPDGIARYVAGLTPVVLTSDTLVTNHGYRNGAATSLQSVLQAGTAVLVDATGTPRVKCNCGNPLAPPQAISLRSATIVGPPWSGYVFTQVTFVQPGGSSARLTLTNTSTGDAYTQDTGSTSGTGLWVATQIDGTDTSSSTTVLTSADGATWRTAADLPGESLRGLVWTHGRWIGVSSGNGFEGTHVLESRDARTWQQVGTVAGAQLSSIAYGKGRWVASGLHWSAPRLATGTPHSELMTYSSTDARSWNGGTAKGIDAYANGSPLPVTFAGGSFFAVATTDEFTSGGLQGVVWTSTDGSRWSSNGGRPVVDGTVSLASGPGTFVLGGSALAGTPLAVSTDAKAWSPAPLPGGSLPGLTVASIGYGGGRFLAATQGTSVSGEVVASPDGRTWTAIGSAAGSATLDALAYGRSLQAEATTAPTTAAGSPPCTKQALQTVFSDEPDDDMNVAMVDSTDPLVCVNGWTALHYGNQGRYLLAVFRANGSVWQTYGYTHEPDGGEGWRETAPSVCAQPGFPQEMHPIVCPGR